MSAIPIQPQQRDPDAPEQLTDDELRGIVQQEIEQAINCEGSEIAAEQERMLRYYRGDKFGNEVAGSSQVVMHTVAEAIDWAMPALMRSFFTTNEIVRYEDCTPESEQAGHGRRMTQVVNEIFRHKLRGLRVTHDWAKAGLLEMFATVKFWVEKVREPTIPQVQEGIPIEVLVELTSMPDVEIRKSTQREDGLFDIEVRKWREYFRLRLETVPPEEFLCSSRATRLDQEIDFVAHQRRVTRSEVYSLGIPWGLVSKLPTSRDVGKDGRKIERDSNQNTDINWSSRKDKASQTVTITESYIRVDVDGDGYSELRRVMTGGDDAQTLLEHDYAPMHGFAGWCPMPMPHQLYGRSSVVSDLQEIGSTLLRQLLDNIYRMNNARHAIVEGDVDIDSYLDTQPGAPVIVQRADAIAPLPTPALPPWSFEALAFIEKVGERRTGIHPYSQESYSAGQNQTAQGVSTVFEAAMAQIQLLCQMLGCGLEDLFRIIPRMMKAAGMGPDRIKVGDEWIDYNPQEWPDEMRVSVQVGLSPGQTEQRIQRLLLLLSLQEKAAAMGGMGYMVTPEQFFNTAIRIVEQSGFQDPSAFFSSPVGKEPPPPQPTPEEITAQSEAANKQAQRALDLSKQQMELQLKREQEQRLIAESAEKYQVERERIAMEERVRRYEVDKRYAAALTQAQVGLVSGGTSEDGTPSGPSPSPVLAQITSRLKKLEELPVKMKTKRNALGLVDEIVKERVLDGES